MVKKLLMMGLLLLMLTFGLVLIPAHVAHADTCNGQCGQDPVQAGCTYSQYIMSRADFTVGNSTWEIRLRSTFSHSSACYHKVWASLVLIGGSNNLNNSISIQVYNGLYQEDFLYSRYFQSNAYTNMIDYDGTYGTCAQYDGNNQSPRTCVV